MRHALPRSGLSHIFKNDFPYFFNIKFKQFTTIIYLHFSKILLTKHKQRKNIYRTVISVKEQNLNKETVEFRISILFQSLVCISAKFNTFSISSIPRGSPSCYSFPHKQFDLLNFKRTLSTHIAAHKRLATFSWQAAFIRDCFLMCRCPHDKYVIQCFQNGGVPFTILRGNVS